jgi:ketosteroid isomerase-like protein
MPDSSSSRRLVERYFDMWNSGHGADADDLLAATYLDHAQPGVLGPAATRALVPRFHDSADARMKAEIVAASDDFVAARRTIRTIRNGQPSVSTGVVLFRVAGGKLAEQWSWSEGMLAPAPAAGPRAVWERAHQFLRDGYDTDGFADSFTDDGVLERPFVPPGMARRIEGREEIRRALAPMAEAARKAGRRIRMYEPLVVRQTADPDVIVVEFDLHGEDGSGEHYRLPYVQIVQVRDGRIALLRDYFDSYAMAERLKG